MRVRATSLRALIGVAGLLAATADVRAQPRPARVAPRPLPATSAPAPSTLRARVGTEAAARLMRSADADDRLRGLQRAAATHTSEALALLQRAATPGASAGAFDPRAPIDGVARTDPRALLTVVRGLAIWTDRESARAALAAILSAPAQSLATRVASLSTRDPAGAEAEGAARILLARQEAAIALAESGGQLAVEALVAAARRTGDPGQAAALDALALHPPVSPVLGGVALTTPASIALATTVGDLRSLDAIEGALRTSDAGLRAAALAALGAFGDVRGLDAARGALHDPEPRVRVAAVEALVRLDAPEAARSVETLIGDDATASAGLRLAQEVQGEGVTKAAAARALASADRELRAAAVAALGRQAGASAVSALLQLAGDPPLAGDAAYALGRSASPAARAALESLAANAATRRLAARAYLVRRIVRGERTARMDAVLHALATSADARDRAVAVQALVALGERSLAWGLGDADPRVRRAAVSGATASPAPREAAILIARLGVETDGPTRELLALGLVDGAAAAAVPTSSLVDRAEAGGADAPLAVLELARRLDDAHVGQIDALLGSGDPLLRAHAAWGQGQSASRDATGRLARAYEWEAEAGVRRALVRALCARDDGMAPSRRETLELAGRLDPDRLVRRLARLGLEGGGAGAQRQGADIAWIRLVAPEGSALPSGATAALVGADGIARPIAFDDEGYALVPGMPPGEASLRLAPRLPAYESPGP